MFAWKLASRVLPPSAGFSGATLGVRHANAVYGKASLDRAAQVFLPVLQRSARSIPSSTNDGFSSMQTRAFSVPDALGQTWLCRKYVGTGKAMPRVSRK